MSSPTALSLINCNSADWFGIFSDTTTAFNTYSSLDPHQQLLISFNAWFTLTSPSESLGLYVDNILAATAELTTPTGTVDCNSDLALDYGTVSLSVLVDHVLPSVTLTFAMAANMGDPTHVWYLNGISITTIDCISKCLACTGPSDGECTSCSSGYFLSSGSCVTSCPGGTYPDSVTNACLSCDLSCTDCAGGTNADCSSCNANYYSSSGLCLPCSSECQGCVTTATYCVACTAGYYMWSTNNSCVACNVPGVFISGSDCQQCGSNCETCSGTPTTCLTCPAGWYFVASNSTCVLCNVDNYYQNGANCDPCHVDCLTCDGPLATDCLSCPLATFYLSSNQSCTTCDEDGYSAIAGFCEQCDSSCKKCSSTSQTGCTECYSGVFLLLSNNTCTSCTANGVFQDGIYCSPCDVGCETCSGSAAVCGSCAAGYYMVTLNSSCVLCDVENYYQNGANCDPCHLDCLTCNGPLATNCLTCPTGTYLFPVINSCMACSGDGYSPIGASCEYCDSSCRRCSDTTSTGCTACYSGKYLFSGNNTCTSCIDMGFFINGYACSLCNSNCKTCVTSAVTCTSCNTGLYLMESNSTCLACNAQDYYIMLHTNTCSFGCDFTGFYIQDNKCLQCESSCLNCTGGDRQDCLVCASGYFRNPFNISCDSSCPSPLVRDSGSSSCIYPHSFSDFADFFQSNMETTTSKTSPKNVARLIASQASQLAYYGSTHFQGTGCPACSGHGSCSMDSNYQVERCRCDDEYSTLTCVLNSTHAAEINETVFKVLTFVANQANSMRLTTSSSSTQSYLDAIFAVVSTSFTNDDIATKAMSIVQGLVNQDVNNRRAGDVFDPAKMQTVLQIVDACLTYVNSQDCIFSKADSQKLFNNSQDVMNGLGLLQLYGKNASSEQYVLNSTNIHIGSKRVSNNMDLSIVFGTNPQTVVQMVTKGSLPAGASVDINLQYWKSDITTCPKFRNTTLPPTITVAINEIDTLRNSSSSSLFAAKLFYPYQNKNYSACTKGCTPSKDEINSTSYFICDCQSLSFLSAADAFLNVFANSNLGKLINAAALLDYDYPSSWVFWLLVSETTWYVISFGLIIFKVIKTLKYKIPKEKNKKVTLRSFKLKGRYMRIIGLAFCVSTLILFEALMNFLHKVWSPVDVSVFL